MVKEKYIERMNDYAYVKKKVLFLFLHFFGNAAAPINELPPPVSTTIFATFAHTTFCICVTTKTVHGTITIL